MKDAVKQCSGNDCSARFAKYYALQKGVTLEPETLVLALLKRLREVCRIEDNESEAESSKDFCGDPEGPISSDVQGRINLSIEDETEGDKQLECSGT